jgi:hypothetical protein
VGRAALSYVALVFGAGFLLGMIRVPLLVPRLGVRTAELLEMPVMLVVSVLAARFVVRRFALPPSAGVRLPVGVMALALLVAAELLMALALQDQSLVAYIGSRDPVSGGVYLAMLVLFAAMPVILSRVEAPAHPPGNDRHRVPRHQ